MPSQWNRNRLAISTWVGSHRGADPAAVVAGCQCRDIAVPESDRSSDLVGSGRPSAICQDNPMGRVGVNEVQEIALQKWRDRWPEWAIADVFIAPAQRLTAAAWFSLLMEWEDLLCQPSEQAIVAVKLQWWQLELSQWSSQRSSHPIAGLLMRFDAPWQSLAEALDDLAALASVPPTFAQAEARLARVLDAMAAVEMRLFADQKASDRRLLLLHGLEARCRGATGGPAGMSMAAWRRALLDDWPQVPQSGRARRLLSTLTYQRLQRTIQSEDGGCPRVGGRLQLLWRCWRSATQA